MIGLWRRTLKPHSCVCLNQNAAMSMRILQPTGATLCDRMCGLACILHTIVSTLGSSRAILAHRLISLTAGH